MLLQSILPNPYRPPDVGWQARPSDLKLQYLKKYARGHTALDVGCGMGWYASALADAGFEVKAIDQAGRLSDDRIEFYEQKVAPPLPLADQSVDTVVMFDVLEHLPDEAGILQEVARVCKERLILSVPHSDAGPLPKYGLTYSHYVDDTHLREYTLDSLRGVLEAHGFRTLYIALEGQTSIVLAFCEFVRGGTFIKELAMYFLLMLYKIGLLYNKDIAGDIFYVGERIAPSP